MTSKKLKDKANAEPTRYKEEEYECKRVEVGEEKRR
jgi:hypothetical protein